MISNVRAKYGSAQEWLAALMKDEAWLGKLQELQNAKPSDYNKFRDIAIKKMEEKIFYGPWDTYHHVGKAVQDLWDSGLSLGSMKHKAVGMLMIEWLEQHSMAGITKGTKKTAAKNKSAKSKRTRERMTFGCKSGVTEVHLTLLYQKLVNEGWIEGNEVDFRALFTGKRDEECQLIWGGLYGKGTLVELFRQFVSAGLVTVPNGFTLPAILEGHFKDTNGQWLTSLDKGNAANDKALPFIKECVKLLKATPEQMMYGNYDDDEDFQSQYDPYDHQDLNLHKR